MEYIVNIVDSCKSIIVIILCLLGMLYLYSLAKKINNRSIIIYIILMIITIICATVIYFVLSEYGAVSLTILPIIWYMTPMLIYFFLLKLIPDEKFRYDKMPCVFTAVVTAIIVIIEQVHIIAVFFVPPELLAKFGQVSRICSELVVFVCFISLCVAIVAALLKKGIYISIINNILGCLFSTMAYRWVMGVFDSIVIHIVWEAVSTAYVLTIVMSVLCKNLSNEELIS